MPSPGFHAHAAAVMRSLLFVPADDAKKLDKAMASGADAVIVDLEDSIPAQGKADARMQAAAFIKGAVEAARRPRLLVRVNGFATGLADADLDAVVPARPDAIMLPKAEGGADVVRADAKLLAREAIAGLPEGSIKIVAIATVTVDFRNTAALRRETEEARRDGFTGKMAIHPAQVPVINEVFTPSAAAIAEARAVVAAFDANPGKGTVGIGGVMYDRPHLERARQLLARATAAGITS